jgi:uncharacterized membrane protein
VTELYAINDRGDIVGACAERDTFEQHGFRLDRHGRITEINVDGRQFTFPLGINDRRQVVGYTSDPGTGGAGTNIHGFAFLQGLNGPVTSVDFPGAPQTAALGINDRGQIVGAYENSGATGRQRATAEGTTMLGDRLPFALTSEVAR